MRKLPDITWVCVSRLSYAIHVQLSVSSILLHLSISLTMGYSSLGQAVPQLANLASHASESLAPEAGGQNFTYCCLRAVNQSLSVNGPNGSLTFNSPSYFLPSLTISELQSSITGPNFPCGASWSGDTASAPVVRVPYGWCRSQCGGWQISRPEVLSQCIGPLVQFILPSLAFCLNVPRVRKLAIPNFIFQAQPRSLRGFATYWLRLFWALLLMTIDTFGWLSICFAFAGPMLLSAVYEFVLDRKVLEFLDPSQEKTSKGNRIVSKRLKAQLLLSVVIGNVRLSTVRGSSTLPTVRNIWSDDDPEILRKRSTSASIETLADNTWSRVMAILDESDHGDGSVGKVSLSTKLKAILNSQARYATSCEVFNARTKTIQSFGSTIGGPILFFVGSFIYTTIDIKTSALGDDDTAHALAFGMCKFAFTVKMISATNGLNKRVYDGTPPGNHLLCHACGGKPRRTARHCLGWWCRSLSGPFCERLPGLSQEQYAQASLAEVAPEKSTWLQACRDHLRRAVQDRLSVEPWSEQASVGT